jgi:hypothetical protein
MNVPTGPILPAFDWNGGRLQLESLAGIVGIRTVKANIVREAAALVDAADSPLTAEHAVIDNVLVDAVAKAGWAHGEWHQPARRFISALELDRGRTFEVDRSNPAKSNRNWCSHRRPASATGPRK